ncbi:GNAT family N-acetyltransferase [Segnochrobactrum spirostomi]|uniref:N-acetyltransferase n=1 Tax=Segnochrobactrum spirostomi TaxID=2608987 RepID=A0A6A7Y6G0_9HYPH|nr:N-acetyltransferase [Segnochrobactrum spirostomi]MQT13252.1 N-acetyltransferase [Segnochrobactrum spirostomi]
MKPLTFLVRHEMPEDHAWIEAIHALAFGPGRFAKTAYRLREGIPADLAISFVTLYGGVPCGSVRLTPITIGDDAALLLGPLAIHPDMQGRGGGGLLVNAALEAARDAGHRLVLLVGDPPYYQRFGFEAVPFGRITLPGPVDPARLMIAGLVPGAAAAAHGMARRISTAG